MSTLEEKYARWKKHRDQLTSITEEAQSLVFTRVPKISPKLLHAITSALNIARDQYEKDAQAFRSEGPAHARTADEFERMQCVCEMLIDIFE